MTSLPLYDLSPAAWLLAVGASVAMLPLAWVWRQHRRGIAQGKPGASRLHALTLLTLFLTFDLIVFGAFTRLTDSGLGCPDWPGCYGQASPITAVEQISQAQAAMPSGPVTHSKAWIEMLHRYLATAVGALIVVVAVGSWRAVLRHQPPHHRQSDPFVNQQSADLKVLKAGAWWATAALVWVCVQGAFGALTVTMKLFPAIVTLHLMGGLLLLALLCAVAVQQGAARMAGPSLRPQFSFGVTAPLRLGIYLSLALLTLQVGLGGWVSTNYAVLACQEVLQCQGSLWPPMDFEQGFQIWRTLGMTAAGDPIGFAALTAIHMVHRMVAVVAVLALLALAFALRQAHRPSAQGLAGLVLLQAATGLSNAVLGWPLLAALMHTGGAAALVLLLSWLVCRCEVVAKGTLHAPSPMAQPMAQPMAHSGTNPSQLARTRLGTQA